MGMEISELPSIDRIYWQHRTIIKNGLSAAVWGGCAFCIFMVFYLNPGGPGLGITNSPQRDLWRAILATFQSLPVAIWQITYWMDHQQWVAEANGEEYEAGKYYPIVTTKRLLPVLSVWPYSVCLVVSSGRLCSMCLA